MRDGAVRGFVSKRCKSNLSVIFAALDATSPTKGRLWHSVTFSSKSQSVSAKTKPLCQCLPFSRKDSLRPEGDVALATEGGWWHAVRRDGEVVPRSAFPSTPTPFPFLPWYDISKGGGCIKTVIYLDVLLLTNFVLGALFLLAAGLVSGQRCSGGRALCGAAVAAASSLALLAPTAPWSVGLLYKGGTGALAVAAAYGWPGWRAFVRLLAWFWLLNLMLTGAVLLPGVRMEVNNLSVYLPLSPEVLLVSAGCVYGGLTLALHLLGDGKKACFPAELEIAGVVLPVRAFHDTGFGVREPLSGCGVVLVRFAAVEARLPPALRTYLKETFSGSGILPPPELGVRLVPCDTVAGHCLLPAVPAQALRWTARGRQQTRHGLYAAFCDMPPPPPGWTLLVGSDVMEGS